VEEAMQTHEELQKANEELQQFVRSQMSTEDGGVNPCLVHAQAYLQLLSRVIMEEHVPPH